MLGVIVGLFALVCLARSASADDSDGTETGSDKAPENKTTGTETDDAGAAKIEMTQGDWDAEKNREYERGLKRAKGEAEALQQVIEEARLAEAGKHQELLALRDADLERLKAEVAAKEFQVAASDALTKEGLADLKGVILSNPTTAEEVIASARNAKTLLDGLVDAEVNKRLKGDPAAKGTKGSTSGQIRCKADLKNDAEVVAYTREHGHDAYRKLPRK